MRVFFTFLSILYFFTSFSQTTVLIGSGTGSCGSGSTNNMCPGPPDLCSTTRLASEAVSVPPGSRVSYSFTQGVGCGASTGYKFDGGENVTVSYGSTSSNVFSGSGTNGTVSASGSGCYYNNGTASVTVTFSGGGNRQDEAYQLTYEVIPGDIMCTPLPIELSYYNLKLFKASTIISFSTASETNNDYFTIERSGDGKSFESIGEIKGAGNSNQELSYEFVDESPLAGINFYRIKQTDFDGAYSYTEIRSVRHQTKNVIVSPNRTDGKLNVTSELDNYDVVIYNTGGQEVQRHMALSGDQSLSIETLQAGVYFVKVMDQTIRILKF